MGGRGGKLLPPRGFELANCVGCGSGIICGTWDGIGPYKCSFSLPSAVDRTSVRFSSVSSRPYKCSFSPPSAVDRTSVRFLLRQQ